jgi:hypothetical protein
MHVSWNSILLQTAEDFQQPGKTGSSLQMSGIAFSGTQK